MVVIFIAMRIMMRVGMTTVHFYSFFFVIISTLADNKEHGCTNQEYNNYCDEDPQPNLWRAAVIFSPVELFPGVVILECDISSFRIIRTIDMITSEIALLELEIRYVTGCIEYLSLLSIKGFPIITRNNSHHLISVGYESQPSKSAILIMFWVYINPLESSVPGAVHRNIIEIGLSWLVPTITAARPCNSSICKCGFGSAFVAHLSQIHSEQSLGFVKPLTECWHDIDTVVSSKEDHGSSFITVLISC